MTHTGPAVPAYVRDTQATHRSAVNAVDKLVLPTMATLADNDDVVGVMAASAHYATVAPCNAYGTAGASNVISNTPTENKTADLTVPQVTGATHYDVFYSTDAAPKWVARITEAQRASGCAITAVGTVTTTDGDGWTKSAGKVNIRLVGTGIQTSNAVYSQNNAYTPASVTAITTEGYNKIYLDVSLALTDLRSAPALTIVPFTSSDNATWYQGTSQVVSPLAYLGSCLYQQYEMDLNGAKYMAFLVGTISGQGAAVTVKYQLVR
jgi:hypothetical protein